MLHRGQNQQQQQQKQHSVECNIFSISSWCPSSFIVSKKKFHFATSRWFVVLAASLFNFFSFSSRLSAYGYFVQSHRHAIAIQCDPKDHSRTATFIPRSLLYMCHRTEWMSAVYTAGYRNISNVSSVKPNHDLNLFFRWAHFLNLSKKVLQYIICWSHIIFLSGFFVVVALAGIHKLV